MKKMMVASLVVGLAAMPMFANAEGGAFRVRAGVSSVSVVSPGQDVDFKSDYTAVGVGAAYITPSGWYFDVGQRNSVSATFNAKDFDYNDIFPTYDEETGNSFIYGAPPDNSYGRKETTLTIGKAIGDGWSVFGGVQTSIISSKAKSIPVTASNLFGGSASSSFDLSVEDKGRLLFGGIGKSFHVGSGSLGLSLALGVYSVKSAWDYSVKDGDSGNLVNLKSDNGAGASIGLSYFYPFSEGLGLTVDMKLQSYSVEFEGESSKEKVGSLGVALVGTF